jgi:hypothetical protein
MIKRVMKFDKQDWKHCWWLFRNMIKQFLLLEFAESYEAWLLLKLHITYDSNKR